MKHPLFLIGLLVGFGLLGQENPNYTQLDLADFKRAKARIAILPYEKAVKGLVTYDFEVLKETDSLFIDAVNMDFQTVKLDGKTVKYTARDDKLWFFENFKTSDNHRLEIEYFARPEAAMYFINWETKNTEKQVWTQGQGKNNSHWLPSFNDLREKVEFDLSFEFPSEYKVIANGRLVNKSAVNDSVNLWEYDMTKPMSSYLMGMAAGSYFSKIKTSASGVKMELYMRPEDSLYFEPTYRYATQIMDLLEKKIGVPYPWQNYKQIPVQDFLYAGMENTSATIFSNSLVTDSIGFKDRNFININAHELAHQWFGDLVTGELSKEHWLHEGFATYYAWLVEKELFGDDYFYWQLYESAEKLKKLSDKGIGEAVYRDNASSITYYQKGAWALHFLRNKIGEAAFKQGIKNYLKLYKYKTANTQNFIAEMERSSGKDLSGFVEDWLEQSAFKAYAALDLLKESSFITNYLPVAGLRETPLSQKYEQLEAALAFPVNDYVGQEVVFQLAGNSSSEALKLYRKAFRSNNVFVRQAIATSIDKIPATLQQEYESLLKDESYLTQEAALMNLWQQFPEKRVAYLEQTRNLQGFYNKNLRMLWLTLSLATAEFEPENTDKYYEELAGYSDTGQAFERRENAFGYLYQINSFTDKSLQSLVQATQHHTYSFRNFARQLLKELLKNEKYQIKLRKTGETMTKEKTKYLQSLINI